jgi:hypothetical protein
MRASVGHFAGNVPVTYADGVYVMVESIEKGMEAGKGPGVVNGRPNIGFLVILHNGAGTAIDLNQVVVTTTYGTPARVAAPVYDDARAQDFSGVCQVHKTRSAMYFFAVPTAERGTITLTVDFDARHDAAVFRGTVA